MQKNQATGYHKTKRYQILKGDVETRSKCVEIFNDDIITVQIYCEVIRYHTTSVLRPFFPGPSGYPGEPVPDENFWDFMVQGKINRGRHTDHPAGRHNIQTNQCPPPPSSTFYRLDAVPAAQPTVSKH